MDYSFDCTICFLLKWGYKLISNPIVLFGLGILSTLLIFYFQYKRSIAAIRLKSVITATKDIMLELKKTTSYTGYIRNRARFSLGVPLDIIAQTYRANTTELYPNLVDINKDRWHDFEFYVRPVINDITYYAFLGWVPLNNELKQLQMLVTLCNAIENVVAELDVVIQIQINEGVSIIEQPPQGGSFTIKNVSNHTEEIKVLLNKYDELKKVWFAWLDVIGAH